jgi:hypothetical protein
VGADVLYLRSENALRMTVSSSGIRVVGYVQQSVKDTVGFGSTANKGIIIYQNSDDNFYGLRGTPPVWTKINP